MKLPQTAFFSALQKVAAAALLAAILAPSGAAQSSPRLVQVSVAKDGTTFGLLPDRSVVVLQNNEWKLMPGKLVQISVGGYDNVWGVNHEQRLFRLAPEGWQVQSGLFTAVAAASDGSAVALDLAGNPFQWLADRNALVPLPNAVGAFTKVAIGRQDRIYALNAEGKVFKYNARRASWLNVRGKFKDIFVSSDGLVSARDYQNIPFSRTDAAVDLELQGGAINVLADWSKDTAIENSGLILTTPINASKTTGLDIAGQPIVIESSSLTVERSPTDPDEMTLSPLPALPEGCTQMVSNGCMSLTLNFSIDTSDTHKVCTIVKPSSGCYGKWVKKVIPPDIQTDANKQTTVGRYFSFSRADAQTELTRQAAETSATASCSADTTTFGTASARSYVQFQLPQAEAGRTIYVPNGAYNNYVFPACNRVWWDAVTFSCRNGKWALTKGKYGADGLCHGWAGPSPFVKVGKR
ncbi:MAG: hypothetical protein H7Y20_03030 [Bryobacteraceae bacterium]|nr:hypothetical protein [Bryobacteraceae bacterium]